MRNIEIKARFVDLQRGRALARELSARFVGEDHQIDTYFHVSRGRLKLRESTLSGGQLVAYERLNEAQARPSDYVLVYVADTAQMKQALAMALGVSVVVEKQRTIYLYENVRIHLDRVTGLGEFIEFEAVCADEAAQHSDYQKVRFLSEHFALQAQDLIDRSYGDLLGSDA